MLKSGGYLIIRLFLGLITMISIIGTSCNSRTDSVTTEPAEIPGATQESVNTAFLGQNLASLKDSNGKIVAIQALPIEPPFAERVDVYQMRSLSDGLEVVGFIVNPKGNQGKLPPLIYNRGGSREEGKIDAAMLPPLATFAIHGYVVIASQYRGNDGGQGKDEYGASDVNDVLNLIPLAESLPFVSPGKVFMLGASRGGMMTYIALSRTDKIKAAAVYSGLVDCIQTYNEREQGMKLVLIDLIGGTPEQKEADYKLRSVNYWPEKINTPVLILHGDADQNVNVTQAQNLADKLKALGKTYELVIYPGGSHGLIEVWQDRNDKIFKWFEKHS